MSEDDREEFPEDDREEFGDDRDGFSEATSRSEGDPRVVIALNAVLSTVFAVTITGGLAYLEVVEYTLVNVATMAVVLFSVAYLATSR
jgi:hypothetical protein